jgi:hypothetical protein
MGPKKLLLYLQNRAKHGWVKANTASISLARSDFDRFYGALIGVTIGAALAVSIACVSFPPPSASDPASLGTLEWTKGWARHDERKMAFFVLTLLLGSALGGIGAWLRFGGRQPTLLSVFLLALTVPVMTTVFGIAMTASAPIAAALGIISAIVISYGSFALRKLQDVTSSSLSPLTFFSPPDAGLVTGPFRPTVFAGLSGALLMILFVVPPSARSIATAIGFDMHMASFMVGPATYSFGSNLVPGIDYFTQYSVGTPWLFSFFLAPTAVDTMENAVWFVIVEILFFQITLFLFLWWFLRSWAWAIVMSIAILMMQFTTSAPLYAPSSTAARYPLLMLATILFVFWVKRNLSPILIIPLALSLAGSLFLGTETGLYTCAAVGIATIVAVPTIKRTLGRLTLLGILTVFAFTLLNLVAFGPRVISARYFGYLIEPMLLYSGGLGSWSLEWTGGIHWFYNVISPAIALATLGWVAIVARQNTLPSSRPHLAALAMVSCVGLFLTAKFINMSLIALWQVNSLGLLIVLAWWSRTLIEQLANYSIIWKAVKIQSAATASLFVMLIVFLCTIEDPRNPSLYAVNSYRTHPSLVNELLGGQRTYPCPPERTGCAATPVRAEDVTLITRLTRPHERVALLTLQDWPLLIEAHRASKFAFLPSAVIFTERQLSSSLGDINLIFLPREPAATFGITHPDMARILVPMLRDNFSLVGETPDLLAWERIH